MKTVIGYDENKTGIKEGDFLYWFIEGHSTEVWLVEIKDEIPILTNRSRQISPKDYPFDNFRIIGNLKENPNLKNK